MFLIAPQDESNGEASLSVEKAKLQRKKWEAINQLRPSAHSAVNLACIYYTIGEGTLAMLAIDTVREAVKGDTRVPNGTIATVLLNRGMFLRGFGRFKEADESISDAWKLDKSSSYLAMAYAEECLRRGDWAEGWKIHNTARGTCDGAAMSLGLPMDCKFWDGKEHPEHLMVINEGGAGDRINYTRFLPLLTKRGIKWSFFCFDEFKPFYERLPWIPKDALIGERDAKEFAPPPTHWTTTFSLAGPLGITPSTIPDYPTPYMPPAGDFHFNVIDSLPIIGLAWSANELFQGGLKVRSLTEGQAMRLVSMTGDKVHWVNLQHSHKMPKPVMNVEFTSWQDTAELINACDAVVTVDCGTLWLSAAMHKPTAVILSSSEDWKFQAHSKSDNCIWSPTAKLYRNGESPDLFDVETAIDNLIRDIRKGVFPKK